MIVFEQIAFSRQNGTELCVVARRVATGKDQTQLLHRLSSRSLTTEAENNFNDAVALIHMVHSIAH